MLLIGKIGSGSGTGFGLHTIGSIGIAMIDKNNGVQRIYNAVSIAVVNDRIAHADLISNRSAGKISNAVTDCQQECRSAGSELGGITRADRTINLSD